MSTKCVRLGNVCQCECKMCDPKAPSLLAELASIPIALVTFLYGLRVVKYFCIIDISDVLVFVFDTVVGFFGSRYLIKPFVKKNFCLQIRYELKNVYKLRYVYLSSHQLHGITKFNLSCFLYSYFCQTLKKLVQVTQ